MTKILMTGSSGFVAGLVSGKFKDAEDVEFVEYDIKAGQDIFNEEQLEEAMSGADVVVHMVAYPHRGMGQWPDYERLNVNGTKAVYGMAKKLGVPRFVYCSTGNLYCFGDGFAEQDNRKPPIKLEDLPENLEMVDPYPRSKIVSERWLSEQVNEDDAPEVIALRINWILGQDLPVQYRNPSSPEWHGAIITPPRMAEGFFNACFVSLPGPYVVVDLIEKNENYEGAMLASDILFDGN